jgi:hypothetical protein
MNRIHFILLTCSYTFFLSCNTPQTNPVDDKDTITQAGLKQNTGREVVPELWLADSIQVLYYDDPDGDSLRYSRYFSYTVLTDTLKIHQLLQPLAQPFAYQTNVRNCRSEGKIYLFSKERELKTLYFSTKSDSCSYIYLIRDGVFHYFPLTNSLSNTINSYRKLAIKP